jgi:hypothetical protein
MCLGHVVAQLVEVLRYKPECRLFDSQWDHWDILIHLILSAALWPLGGGGVSTQSLTEIMSPRGKDGRFVVLTTLPPSCTDCLGILGAYIQG